MHGTPPPLRRADSEPRAPPDTQKAPPSHREGDVYRGTTSYLPTCPKAHRPHRRCIGRTRAAYAAQRPSACALGNVFTQAVPPPYTCRELSWPTAAGATFFRPRFGYYAHYSPARRACQSHSRMFNACGRRSQVVQHVVQHERRHVAVGAPDAVKVAYGLGRVDRARPQLYRE